MNADLQAFVRDALARGIGRDAIGEKLREAGWRADEIGAALSLWAETEFPVPVPRRRPYLSAREAFLYLVLFATLYATAFNVGAVLFTELDRWFPDASQRESAQAAAAAARGATAGLIIAFPIFLVLSRVIGRATRQDPEKRVSKIRKWLTYLTLFVAAMVLIGDLTFLVSQLLSGEIATRVLLKVLVVLAIAGVVFSHYLAELRVDERESAGRSNPRLPPRLVAGAVLIVLAMGLFVSGSPRRERLRRLDAERLGDLRSLSTAVSNWARDHRQLPASLATVAAEPDAPSLRLLDPQTRRPYEYRTLDARHFELCAAFESADSLLGPDDRGEASTFWKHDAGRACYVLEIPASSLNGTGPPKVITP